MGVVLWHKLSLDGTVVTNDAYGGGFTVDATVEVRYAIGEAPAFSVEVHDLPLPKTNLLSSKLQGSSEGADGGVPMKIELGYFDGGPKGTVLEGRIDRMGAAVRDRPLVTTVMGHDLAGHRLLHTTKVSDVPSPPARLTATAPKPLKELVQTIAQAAGIAVDGKVTPEDKTFESLALDGADALDLLDGLAERVGAEWYVQDGKLAFGTAIQNPMPGFRPSIPDPTAISKLLTGGASLLPLGTMKPARLARLTPLTLGKQPRERVGTDLPPADSVQAFDFVTLGEPTLRAGQMVIASVADYASPFSPFRILSVTHRYSPREGYTCSGRAAAMAAKDVSHANRQRSDQARDATASSVAGRIAERGRREQALRPSIDVGRVRAAKPSKRAASLYYRQEPAAGQPSPSVDADIGQDNAQLVDKPLASPFAWHKVGLSVPVYPGMRALLAQVRDVREDAVAAGFLWANQPDMQRPDSQDGDWWLCLPTRLGSDGLPAGKGANDLIAKDGRRVIEATGLLVTVGKTTPTDVGIRPSEGNAGEVEIRHDSGATVKISSKGAITVQSASGMPLKLTDGATSVEIGAGQVSLSGGAVQIK